MKKRIKKERGSLLEPQFRDEDAAREWLEAKRWPDGAVCPHCGLVGEAYKFVVKEKTPEEIEASERQRSASASHVRDSGRAPDAASNSA